MKARIKRKIQKRPFLYNVGQVFKACDWLTEIQRGNIVWHRYHSFGTITKSKIKKEGIDGSKEHNRFCMKHKNKRMKNEKNNYCSRYD